MASAIRFFTFFLVVLVFPSFSSEQAGEKIKHDEHELIELTRVALALISDNKMEGLESLKIVSCGGSCVSFKSSELEWRVQIDSTLQGHYSLVFDNQLRVLVVSSTAVFNLIDLDVSIRSTFRRWLTGHELHPYSVSSHRTLLSKPKPVQETALEASRKALDEGVRSLLLVAPTATGKTWVLVQTLMKQIREFNENSSEKNVSGSTYTNLTRDNPRFFSYGTLASRFRKKHDGSSKGLLHFLLTGEPPEPKPNERALMGNCERDFIAH